MFMNFSRDPTRKVSDTSTQYCAPNISKAIPKDKSNYSVRVSIKRVYVIFVHSSVNFSALKNETWCLRDGSTSNMIVTTLFLKNSAQNQCETNILKSQHVVSFISFECHLINRLNEIGKCCSNVRYNVAFEIKFSTKLKKWQVFTAVPNTTNFWNIQAFNSHELNKI